jgi:subtilisin family serine protease
MNNSKKKTIGLIIFSLILGRAHADEFKNSLPTITVAPARTNSHESTRILAEIAKETPIQMQKGESPINLIRSRCGVVNKDYLPIFQEANPGTSLESLTEDTTIFLPACFIVAPQKKVLVEKGDSLAIIASKYFGSEGSETLSKIINANKKNINCEESFNPSLARTPPSMFDRCIIKPGQELTLPNVPIAANYLVKESSLDKFTQQKDRLSISLRNDSPSSNRPGILSSSEELIAAAETSSAPEDQCTENEANLPYPKTELIKLLESNDISRDLAIQAGETVMSSTAIVVIADTGLSGFDTPAFPRLAFRTKSPSGYDSGVNRNYGINVYNQQLEPTELKEYNRHGHGTHIAGIARGGVNLTNSETIFFSKRIKLLIAAMLDIRLSSAQPVTYSATTPSGGIINAANYASRESANILNVSFTSNVQINGLADAIKEKENLLVIASAGNTKRNTDFISDVFPYSYGGVNTDSLAPDQFIIVAASQQNGKLAPFSAYGRKNVDLAAPGCRVESNNVNGGSITFSGTSEAAPSVSFTAGLLHFEGINQARKIKARIVSSLDRSAYLEEKVAWGGKLNIIKALSVYQDVLELKSSPSQLLFGRLPRDTITEMHCGETSVEVQQISKVYRNQDAPKEYLHILLKGADGYVKQEPQDCKPANTRFTFKVQGENEPRAIDWADVLDFIPSYYTFDET